MSVKIQFDQEWKKDFVEKFEKDGAHGLIYSFLNLR